MVPAVVQRPNGARAFVRSREYPGCIRQLIVVAVCENKVHNFITSHSHPSHDEQRSLASTLLVSPLNNLGMDVRN